jgi:hypothetical protein
MSKVGSFVTHERLSVDYYLENGVLVQYLPSTYGMVLAIVGASSRTHSGDSFFSYSTCLKQQQKPKT